MDSSEEFELKESTPSFAIDPKDMEPLTMPPELKESYERAMLELEGKAELKEAYERVMRAKVETDMCKHEAELEAIKKGMIGASSPTWKMKYDAEVKEARDRVKIRKPPKFGWEFDK
jgi:hypothetical protein